MARFKLFPCYRRPSLGELLGISQAERQVSRKHHLRIVRDPMSPLNNAQGRAKRRRAPGPAVRENLMTTNRVEEPSHRKQAEQIRAKLAEQLRPDRLPCCRGGQPEREMACRQRVATVATASRNSIVGADGCAGRPDPDADCARPG